MNSKVKWKQLNRTASWTVRWARSTSLSARHRTGLLAFARQTTMSKIVFGQVSYLGSMTKACRSWLGTTCNAKQVSLQALDVSHSTLVEKPEGPLLCVQTVEMGTPSPDWDAASTPCWGSWYVSVVQTHQNLAQLHSHGRCKVSSLL